MTTTKIPHLSLQAALLADISVAGRKLRTAFDERVKQYGLTQARARALLHLARTPDLNQTELAALLEVETPTVVRLLDGMARQGLIERHATSGDRRANRVVLTAAALEQVAAIEAIIAELSHRILGDMNSDALETASRVLRCVAQRLG